MVQYDILAIIPRCKQRIAVKRAGNEFMIAAFEDEMKYSLLFVVVPHSLLRNTNY